MWTGVNSSRCFQSPPVACARRGMLNLNAQTGSSMHCWIMLHCFVQTGPKYLGSKKLKPHQLLETKKWMVSLVKLCNFLWKPLTQLASAQHGLTGGLSASQRSETRCTTSANVLGQKLDGGSILKEFTTQFCTVSLRLQAEELLSIHSPPMLKPCCMHTNAQPCSDWCTRVVEPLQWGWWNRPDSCFLLWAILGDSKH